MATGVTAEPRASKVAELIRVIRRSDKMTSRSIVCGYFPHSSMGARICHKLDGYFPLGQSRPELDKIVCNAGDMSTM
jgi:hypothetical protein